jgi:hypothetical protein
VYWSDENPHVALDAHKQTDPRINERGGIHGDAIVGPVFLDNKLTGVRHHQHLENTLQPFLNEMTLTSRLRYYFQQDGAPPHFSTVARQWLNQWLSGRWIGRRDRWNGHHVPDLTPLDVFIWGHLKSVVYGNRLRSIAELQDNIRAECAAITPGALRRVRSSLRRIHTCQQQNGHHFEHYIDVR